MVTPPAANQERLLTLEEFEALPEEEDARLELAQGRIVREPRPGAEHGRLVAQLGSRLERHVKEYRLGAVCMDFGVVLSVRPDTVRGPDIAFIASERIPPEGLPVGFLRIAPDLAVEILSPSNSASEIQRKVLEYLAAGTRLVWVVEPRTRTVTVYRSRSDVRVLVEGDDLGGDEILPGFRLPVGELFAR